MTTVIKQNCKIEVSLLLLCFQSCVLDGHGPQSLILVVFMGGPPFRRLETKCLNSQLLSLTHGIFSKRRKVYPVGVKNLSCCRQLLI